MNRPAVVLALVATFLIGVSLGVLSGFFLSTAFHRPPPRFAGMRERGFGGPGMRERAEGSVGRVRLRHTLVMPRLREALDLSDEQVATIAPLVDEAHRAMGAARESLRVRIERVLSPGQRERWRELETRRGYPGEPRGPLGRTNRPRPGPEGDRP